MNESDFESFWARVSAWVKAEAAHAVTVMAHGERKAGVTDTVLADSTAKVYDAHNAAKEAFQGKPAPTADSKTDGQSPAPPAS